VQSFGEHYLVFVAGYQTPHVRTGENAGQSTRPAGMKIEVFVTKNVAMTGALVGSETQILPALKALVGRIQENK